MPYTDDDSTHSIMLLESWIDTMSLSQLIGFLNCISQKTPQPSFKDITLGLITTRKDEIRLLKLLAEEENNLQVEVSGGPFEQMIHRFCRVADPDSMLWVKGNKMDYIVRPVYLGHSHGN